MWANLWRRILRMLITLLIVLLVTFALTRIAYHDPARMVAPANASEQTIDSIRQSLNLDVPWYVSLWQYFFGGPPIRGVATGLFRLPPSLGYSYLQQRPVLDLILEKLPVTASLAIGALVLWMTLSILAGVRAAQRPGGTFDQVSSVVSYALLSTPSFVTGVLLLFFGFFKLSQMGLRIFPPGGYVSPTASVGDWVLHLVLPWLTLTLVEVGTFQRVVRSAVLEVSHREYIRTARGKGLSPNRVYFDHALSAALNPVLTLGGIEFASLLGGAIITEQIFGLDGVGRLAVYSAINGDAPVVIGCTLLAAVLFVVLSFVIDLVVTVRSRR